MRLRPHLLAAALVFVVPLAFALFTDHVWEDYYITFRASKNLAEGHGLVFQIGEKVHSFTSPLGVLLPAFFYYLTHSDTATLWLFRCASCAALAGAAIYLWQLLVSKKMPPVVCWLVTLILLADSKTVDFAINGMETSFMVLFAAAFLHLLLRNPAPTPFPLGAIMAALMWTRPDSFVIIAAVIISTAVFSLRSKEQVRNCGILLLKSGIWATMLYGPWFAWAWWYYGSPIPHTIIAKSGGAPALNGVKYLFCAPAHYLTGNAAIDGLFNPSNYVIGGWPDLTIKSGYFLSVVAGFAWLWPKLPNVFRIASFAVFLGSYYLQAIPPAPWYFPAWYMLAAVALAGFIFTLGSTYKPNHVATSAVRCVFTALLLWQASHVGLAAVQYKAQQEIVENQGRKAIGEWLRANGNREDTVFLEPLGYIGYFSQMHMLDYPGLCAPSVVLARKQGRSYAQVIEKLHPTWLILRPSELLHDNLKDSPIMMDYRFVKAWDCRPQLEELPFLPGRQVIDFDSRFLVFHRQEQRPAAMLPNFSSNWH